MNRKKLMGLLIFFVSIAVTTLVPSHLTKADASHYWMWSSTRIWKIRAYDTYVKFSMALYCDKIGYDSFPDNTRWYFYNSQMDEGAMLGWWWISIQNGNVTVQKLFKDMTLELNVQVASTATIQFYSSLGKPTSVDGALWEYSSDIVTMTKTDSGGVTIGWTPDTPEWNPDLYVNPYGLINQYLLKGDFLGMIIAPWYVLVGEVIWAVFGFIIFYPMYRRTETVIVPCLILAIIGGSAIGFSTILPFAALRIHYIFTMLGGAAILYKVFGERD